MFVDRLEYRVDVWSVPQSASQGFWKPVKSYAMSKKNLALNRLGKMQARGETVRLVRVRTIDEDVKEEVLWETK